MELITYSPLQTLNKAYRKEKISRDRFNNFREQLKTLFHKINAEESEEHLKYPLRDFFKNTFYSQNEINTKGKTDLGIFLDGTDKSKLGVIIEVKKPSNIADMITQTDLNKKAMHEAILYYLRERIDEKNSDIKHIIITNLYEWFVFDAHDFERLFYKSNLNKEYVKWKTGQKTSANTPLFYTEIARPFLSYCEKEISATWFDLRDYQKALTSDKKEDERKLSALYKIISDVTLLKESFSNDSNSLDRKFYNELLHIIGLEEVKDGSKKTIKRKANPDHGSLLENTISTLETSEKLHRIENLERYGETAQEQFFNISLELVITWINRILFLKLLEGQLVKYHQGNQDFKFLSPKFIADFDELNELFFEVLAKRENERKEYINAKFRNIPYLNSSLFELKQGSLEDNTILVSNLKDRFKLPVYSKTVLTENGRKLTGELSTLKYLLDFIDAYDFSSEGAEEIQEENKSLINASVLGLIFEKINGYKDGSFFTPGFITMYMCRETIRRAVLQKFADTKGWNCETIEQLKDKIEDRTGANEIVNSLKICDPAVGSGHFLVSALNEIIALKSELDILLYRSNGNRVRNYRVEVVNDELVITDKETEEIFEYHLNEKSKPIDYLQELQETLFHEKQTIIENCLFGVDINPNSVNICRLRLWIELLKNAYYIFNPSPGNAREDHPVQTSRDLSSSYSHAAPILQTLPNIDINIKCGNSLISRFPLDADLSKALKSIKYNINTYRKCVSDYKNATNKDDKRSLDILINQIKADFKDEIHKNDPKYIRLNKVKGELWGLTNQVQIFEQSKGEKEEQNKKLEKLALEQARLEQEITETRNNIIYHNAFEWRFEFPEVLDDQGNFLGFDVVIGNPPYIRQEELSNIKPYLQFNYNTFAGTADLYVYFVEKGLTILQNRGEFIFILPNKWMRAGYGMKLRTWIKQFSINSIVDFGDLPVFEEATTYPCLWSIKKDKSAFYQFNVSIIDTLSFQKDLASYIEEKRFKVDHIQLNESGWTLVNDNVQNLIQKIKSAGKPLGEYVNGKIFRGVLTGLNEAFVIDSATREVLIAEDPSSSDIIKPFLAGRDIKRYQQILPENYLILFKSGQTKNMFGNLSETDAWEQLKKAYPSVSNYLARFEDKARARYDKGQYWWELRACDYYQEYEYPKIVWPETALDNQFTLINPGTFLNKTTFFIPSSDFALLGILNSKLIKFFLNSIVSKMRGGYYSLSKAYVELSPICIGDSVVDIEKIVKNIYSNGKEDIKIHQAEIDKIVYKLYDLTEEEITIVESSFV